MNPRISEVVALNDGTLQLTISNAERKQFDIRPCLGYPAFRRLRDPASLRAIKAAHGTACWP